MGLSWRLFFARRLGGEGGGKLGGETAGEGEHAAKAVLATRKRAHLGG